MNTNTLNATKVIIYCRVSSKEQEETGYSLDAQEKLLKDCATKNNFEVVKLFRISESASGKQIRKTFNEMLDYANKHKIPIILCEKIDRLTRNIKDAAIVHDWITGDDGRQVHFVKENFILSKNTRAHENLVWDMKVAIARFYTNNLSEEVRKGQKEKLAQGWLPTKPPIGYKTIGDKGHKIHVLDEEKAPLVRRMFELYSSGDYSINELVRVMHKEGLRNRAGGKFGRSRMHLTLSDPFYYGKIFYKGAVHDGAQEALISKELFEKVQLKLTRKVGSPQYKKHLPVFKAKIACEECGGTITWDLHKGIWYGHHSTYEKYAHCTKKLYMRQDGVEKQLFPHFDKVAPAGEEVLKVLEEALKESHAEEITYNTSRRDEFARAIKVADRRIEEAYKDKIDGKMPVALCEKVIAESTQEKKDALEALEKLADTRQAYYEAGLAIHELAFHAQAIYQNEEAAPEEKRLLLSYVFSNLTQNAHEIKPNYTLAFSFLLDWMPRVNRSFELSKNRTNKGKTGDFSPACPVVLHARVQYPARSSQ